MNKLAVLFLVASALAACGGGGGGADDPAAPDPTAPTPPPPGTPGTPAATSLYVGYYQEDPANNPEDPVPGAFSLNLPVGNASFSGSMFFTYVGCQTSNVGTVSGTKTDAALAGTWSGTVDGLAQSGAYSGSYQAATQSYAGTYTNNGGKQLRNLQPCITYTIAANGSWEMFPIEAAVPEGFTVIVSGRGIRWSPTTGATRTLIYVLDPAIAQTSANPVLWQTVVTGPANSVNVPDAIALQSGKEYVAVVGIGDASGQRSAFGSKKFTP
jgi:hypothetical protein